MVAEGGVVLPIVGHQSRELVLVELGITHHHVKHLGRKGGRRERGRKGRKEGGRGGTEEGEGRAEWGRGEEGEGRAEWGRGEEGKGRVEGGRGRRREGGRGETLNPK